MIRANKHLLQVILGLIGGLDMKRNDDLFCDVLILGGGAIGLACGIG